MEMGGREQARPVPAACGEAAAALGRELQRRIAAAAETIQDLDLAFDSDPGRAVRALESCERRVAENGWLMALVGCGAGAQSLAGRHEPRGLARALELASAAAQAEGGGRLRIGAEPPDLSPPAPWELCWAAACLAWRSCADLEDGGVVELDVRAEDEGWSLRACRPKSRRITKLGRELADWLGPVRFEVAGQGWSLWLPRAWLKPR